mgnify:CR=1 FL=1
MYNLNTKAAHLSNIIMPDPDYGDMTLQMFPFNNSENVRLPLAFSIWQETFDKIRKMIPIIDGDNNHFVTISTRFFSQQGTLRREGLHLDGNFCGDPSFSYATWGGTRTTWAGAAPNFDSEEGWVTHKAWVDPFDLIVPIGKYVSDDLGGIFLLSSHPGCELFLGNMRDIDVGDSGNLEHQREKVIAQGKSVIQGKDECWFISSNTPHESLEIPQGIRRSFMRVTLNCKYPNKLIGV